MRLAYPVPCATTISPWSSGTPCSARSAPPSTPAASATRRSGAWASPTTACASAAGGTSPSCCSKPIRLPGSAEHAAAPRPPAKSERREEAERIARERDRNHVEHGGERGCERCCANGLGPPPLEGDAAKDDVGDEAQDLGRQPAVHERVLAEEPGEPPGAREQHGVDDVRRDADDARLQERRAGEHERAAPGEAGDADRDAGDVEMLDEEVRRQLYSSFARRAASASTGSPARSTSSRCTEAPAACSQARAHPRSHASRA